MSIGSGSDDSAAVFYGVSSNRVLLIYGAFLCRFVLSHALPILRG
jgi:hypothetical protein